ncbi:MAG: acyl-CoA dehydrogenase family protein, partial [Dehalococcoidia bacterium]
MEFRDSPEEATFRAHVRSFLDNEFPAEVGARPGEWGLFNAGGRADGAFRDFYREWTKKLNEQGWGAPHWPKEYGGGGLSIREQFILSEEFAWRRAPRGGGIGHGWAGPTIMVYGTPEQKERYLPRILSGEDMWCQLFSEPGAGSDLASLQTRAIRDGDDYVLNGQKIWTSGAHMAHMGILIARTDPDAPKHRGISYFLVDMKTPGITVRPLVNMLSSHEFNEVYFEDARIPRTALLGEENRGWYTATTTLDFERSGIASSVAHQLIATDLVAFAREEATAKAAVASKRNLRTELADR